MRGWPNIGDRVHVRDGENALRAFWGRPLLEWEVVDVNRGIGRPITLRHPETEAISWYARREIECIVGK